MTDFYTKKNDRIAESLKAESGMAMSNVQAKLFASEVYQLCTDNFINDQNIVFHGSNIFALETLVRTGVFPACERSDYTDGRIYFVRPTFIAGQVDLRTIEEQLVQGEPSYDGFALAHHYASLSGQREYLVRALGLDRNNLEHRKLIGSLIKDLSSPARETISGLTDVGLKHSQIAEAVKNADSYQGIVLAIRSEVLSLYPVVKSDMTDEGIDIPEGVALKFISRIIANGAAEKKFVNELQL